MRGLNKLFLRISVIHNNNPLKNFFLRGFM